MKKEFSKFFVASLKRTAQNVAPLVRRKQKLLADIAEREEELKSIQSQLDTYEAPIKEVTGGYGTEDLVVRTVEVTDKVDKDGKPVKVTKWNLRYPETIVPVVESEPAEGVTDEGPVEEPLGMDGGMPAFSEECETIEETNEFNPNI